MSSFPYPTPQKYRQKWCIDEKLQYLQAVHGLQRAALATSLGVVRNSLVPSFVSYCKERIVQPREVVPSLQFMHVSLASCTGRAPTKLSCEPSALGKEAGAWCKDCTYLPMGICIDYSVLPPSPPSQTSAILVCTGVMHLCKKALCLAQDRFASF